MKSLATASPRAAVILATCAALASPLASLAAQATSLNLVAATGHPASVSACVPHDDLRRCVSYGDLDLASAEGMATLQGRIASAAEAVCRGNQSSGRGLPNRAERQCRKEAVANAVAEAEGIVATTKLAAAE